MEASSASEESVVPLIVQRRGAKAKTATQQEEERHDHDRYSGRHFVNGQQPTRLLPDDNKGVVLDDDDDRSKKTFRMSAPHHTKGPPAFARWSMKGAAAAARRHPLPCVFALCMLFFMGVEYTLRMVPSAAPPVDIGFVLTQPLHHILAARPVLNSVLAALNTVFVIMQTVYILWTFMVEGRPRSTIATVFMFTCRGVLGYSTQLPLPEEFLGSGVDFPVGNVSFFLFFSGHVAGAMIASLDMRRMRRDHMAWTFDALNILQGLRLLASRGHYTIDLAVGVGAGFVFDILAGKYEEGRCAGTIVINGGGGQHEHYQRQLD